MPTIGFTKKKLIVHCSLWEKPSLYSLGSEMNPTVLALVESEHPWNSTAEVRDWALKNGYSGIKITTK